MKFENIDINMITYNPDTKLYTVMMAHYMDSNTELSKIELMYMNLHHQIHLKEFYDGMLKLASCGTLDEEIRDELCTVFKAAPTDMFNYFVDNIYEDYTGPYIDPDLLTTYFPFESLA